jgi:hypothetical protein
MYTMIYMVQVASYQVAVRDMAEEDLAGETVLKR